MDTDVLSFSNGEGVIASKVLMKIGSDNLKKFKGVAYLEMINSLRLNNGLEVSNTLTLGSMIKQLTGCVVSAVNNYNL